MRPVSATSRLDVLYEWNVPDHQFGRRASGEGGHVADEVGVIGVTARRGDLANGHERRHGRQHALGTLEPDDPGRELS